MTRERMVNELAMRPLVVAFAAALAVAWSGEVWASLLLLLPLVALVVMQRGCCGCGWWRAACGVARAGWILRRHPFLSPRWWCGRAW